jgi:hypothetical protein
LQAGFTTVQSVGAALDADLRDLIARDTLPGPRLLTSLAQINEKCDDPDPIRTLVPWLKMEGADVIKLFPKASIPDGK